MSFQGLISGAECAVPSNPLSQVLKHTEGDRSLQQDRNAGPSSSRLHHLPGTAGPAASEHDLAQARHFFDGPPPSSAMHPLPPHHHPHHLAEMQRANGPDLQQAWIEQQRMAVPSSSSSSSAQNWASEFIPVASLSPQSQTSPHSQMQQSPGYSGNMAFGQPFASNMNYSYNMMGPSMYQQPLSSKGKGKEIDFEAAFAQFSEQPQTSSKIEEVQDTDEVSEITDKLERSELKDGDGGFKSVWDQLQNSDVPPPQSDMAKWEAEFNQLMNRQREDDVGDYGAAMQSAWEGGMGDFGTLGPEEHTKFDENGYPQLGEYPFEATNKYMDPSSSSSESSLAAAKALLENNGSLSEAALLIEAAIQKGDLGEGGYEAWILLGEVRNMDEREEAGLKALVEGVKRAEAAGAAGAGMLSLAISFTNEDFDRASHATLRFPDFPIPEETLKALKTHSTWDTHGRITDAFISLAQSQHNQGQMDPDVQVGLGVLFYTNREYDKAKDCFEAALSVRPKDYLLWNRLGSSLSNGNRAEEALGAYREALSLRPTYTRAIYNVGVACLNIGAFHEAAEHLLSALRMQEGTGETSDQLWWTLKRAFAQMERPDLAGLITPENRSLEQFRQHGFDF
ncbi:hypothetical protein DL96DRAFT_1602480 [Flagelloscypha sp. PMI_526]|nr:hypothetical protein DL96DRAFT_1602480 [Flagelloscypha sp. PMI_526]